MSGDTICPCEGLAHPATIANAPNLAHVDYRAGDFRSFRRALLQRRNGETALAQWQPNGRGDLLLQILEWWAYVADVVAFYNERSLNESLLGTATLDESVRRLIRILGYRPRPGISASAKVGALLSGPSSVTLPASFAIDSKPAPGKQPRTYETSADATLGLPDAVPANRPSQLAAGQRLYLSGTISDLKPEEFLLLEQTGQPLSEALLLQVASARTDKDSAGTAFTEITLAGSPSLPVGAAAGFQLSRSRRSVGLWKYSTTINLIASPLELDGVERGIKAGDPFVLAAPGTSLPPTVRVVGSTTEEVWYANGNGSLPPVAPTIPISLPHTRLYYSTSGINTTDWNNNASKVKVLIDWQPAGALRDAPVESYAGTPLSLVAVPPQTFRVGSNQTVLIEDADGKGVVAKATVAAGSPGQLQILSFAGTPPSAQAPLKTPLKVLHNLLDVTHGKSVAAEVLGSGDATLAGQFFTLKKSPLAYLPAGDGYRSTLKIYVNGVAWTEVESFYGQPPDAQVFVTHEAEEQKTHVIFGDGVNGARLPTGRDNVAAYYRFGSGANVPAAGTLTIVAKPHPGLRALKHPVAGGGGSDPDPPDQIRRYAPRSVLTFGRAISVDDYEAIASHTPGVARVRAVYGWTAQEQRATVMLYVGDEASAVDSARAALLASADPNRPVSVLAASAVTVRLRVNVDVEPGRVEADVFEQVAAAIVDPDRGLFGAKRIGIGESIYCSRLSAACLSVPGVRAMPFAFFVLSRPDPVTGYAWGIAGLQPRLAVSEGEYLKLEPSDLYLFSGSFNYV